MIRVRKCSGFLALVLAVTLCAQQAPLPPPGFGPRVGVTITQPGQPMPAQPPKPEPPKPEPPKPAVQPAPAATAPQPSAPAATTTGGLNLQGASLTEVIDILARQMKMNYVLDPRVKGGVFLNTYGEVKDISPRALLDLILRINGFGMVQMGDVYRIVPLSDISRLPLSPQVNPTSVTEDERTSLNLIFLKYASVEELAKLLEPFLGEFSKMYTYAPANLLLILDSNRSMKRTLELIALFDNETFTAQRVKLFEVKNSRPGELAKEIDGVFKSLSLSEKVAPIKFIGLDRINTLIAVASNPTVFVEVEKWLKKLDVTPKITAGSVDNYVYRVKYGRADTLAMAIMSLYLGNMGFGMGMMGMGMMGGGMMGGGMYGGGMGGMYGGGMGGGMYGGGMGGMYGGGMGGMYGGGMGGMYGGGMGGMYGGGMYGGGMPYYQQSMPNIPITTLPGAGATTTGTTAGTDLTGSYLGTAAAGGQMPRIPHVIPNIFDNSLLIQATPQEYEGIIKLLRDLDVSPRQVLIDAKIYEVTLNTSFSSALSAYMSANGYSGGATPPTATTSKLIGSLVGTATSLSAGALVGRSRQLLAFLQLQETTGRTKVISAPSLIATDSIPATMNVGVEVPTLTSTAATGAISGGNTQFAQTVQNRESGVTLAVTARINPSGVVTLVINQEVSSPVAPVPGGINSPSFSKRTVQTQVTLEDGDTIAIGGIIDEKEVLGSSGIPLLHRLPGVGALFGSKSFTKTRTELIIFFTPRVIYDTNQMADATEELRGKLRRLVKIVREREE